MKIDLKSVQTRGKVRWLLRLIGLNWNRTQTDLTHMPSSIRAGFSVGQHSPAPLRGTNWHLCALVGICPNCLFIHISKNQVWIWQRVVIKSTTVSRKSQGWLWFLKYELCVKQLGRISLEFFCEIQQLNPCSTSGFTWGPCTSSLEYVGNYSNCIRS